MLHQSNAYVLERQEVAMAKKAILYLRVSSRRQDSDNQLPALEKWASDNGYEVTAIYRESESAWAEGHQRELARLIRDLPKHKVDILLVWALDRLTRQGIGPILQIVNNFRVHGVQVISLAEKWTDQEPGPMLDLFYAFAGWAANYESNRLSQRVKAGLLRAQKQGKTLGRRPGSKDKGKRKRTGYLLRYATKKSPGKNDDGAGVIHG